MTLFSRGVLCLFVFSYVALIGQVLTGFQGWGRLLYSCLAGLMAALIGSQISNNLYLVLGGRQLRTSSLKEAGVPAGWRVLRG